MNTNISDNLVQVIILDVSGVYAQIHNQGYFEPTTVDEIKSQYSDRQHWRVVVLDWEVLYDWFYIDWGRL